MIRRSLYIELKLILLQHLQKKRARFLVLAIRTQVIRYNFVTYYI